jgi:hypothetical protein
MITMGKREGGRSDGKGMTARRFGSKSNDHSSTYEVRKEPFCAFGFA